jgi:hypothetical protein
MPLKTATKSHFSSKKNSDAYKSSLSNDSNMSLTPSDGFPQEKSTFFSRREAKNNFSSIHQQNEQFQAKLVKHSVQKERLMCM